MRMSLSKWMESMRFEWIEVNRMNIGKMMDLKELTLNPMAKSLWVERKCPYESDLKWVKMKVPIEMNGFNEIWMNWSE